MDKIILGEVSNNTGRLRSMEVGFLMILIIQKMRKNNFFNWLGLLLDPFTAKNRNFNTQHSTRQEYKLKLSMKKCTSFLF